MKHLGPLLLLGLCAGCPGPGDDGAVTPGDAPTEPARASLSAPTDGAAIDGAWVTLKGTASNVGGDLQVVVRWLPPSGVVEEWPDTTPPPPSPGGDPVVAKVVVDPTGPRRLAPPCDVRLTAEGLAERRGNPLALRAEDQAKYRSLQDELMVETAGYEWDQQGPKRESMLPVRLDVDPEAPRDALEAALASCERRGVVRTEVVLHPTVKDGLLELEVPLVSGINRIQVTGGGLVRPVEVRVTR